MFLKQHFPKSGREPSQFSFNPGNIIEYGDTIKGLKIIAKICRTILLDHLTYIILNGHGKKCSSWQE